MGYPPAVMPRKRVDQNGYPIPDDGEDIPLWKRDQLSYDRAMQSTDQSIAAQNAVDESRYPNPAKTGYDLSGLVRGRLGGGEPTAPGGSAITRPQGPGTVYENQYPSASATPDFASQFGHVPLEQVKDIATAFPAAKPEPTMTPYQQEQTRLGQQRNDISQQRASQAGQPKVMTQAEARQLYGQFLSEARLRNSTGNSEDMRASTEELMQKIAQENGVDYQELLRMRAGQVVASGQPAATPQQNSFHVGQQVKLKSGKTVTVTQVHPDGSFEGQ